MPTVDVKVLPMCIVDVIVFTLLCFWIELRRSLSDRNVILWKVYASSVLWRVVAQGYVASRYFKYQLLRIVCN